MKKILSGLACAVMFMFMGVALVACVKQPTTFTVSFRSSESAVGMPAPITVAKGEKISPQSIADPTRANYQFVGWYQDPALTRPWNFQINTVLQNMVLFARWQGISVKVRFDLLYEAADEDLLDPLTVLYNGNYVNLHNPIREGATFRGWWTENGTKTGYWGERVKSGFANRQNTDHILYAKWSYEGILTLVRNQGDPASSADEVAYEYTVDVGIDTYGSSINPENGELPKLRLFGYRFDGWWTKNGYNGVTYDGDWGEQVVPSELIQGEFGEDINIYAKFTKTVMVELVKNGGRGIDDAYGVMPNEAYNLPAPFKTGSLFDGWWTDDNHYKYRYNDNSELICGFQPSNPENRGIIEQLMFDGNKPHCDVCGYTFAGFEADYQINKETGGSLEAWLDYYPDKGFYTQWPPIESPPTWGKQRRAETIMTATENHTLYAKWIDNVVRPVISAGGGISSYIDGTGSMWTWGGTNLSSGAANHWIANTAAETNVPSNLRGDTGHTSRTVPTAPSGGHLGRNYSQIENHFNQTLAIDSNGKLWGWGRGYNGVLGAGHYETQTIEPKQIIIGNDPSITFVDVALNGFHYGTAPSSNKNFNGQLFGFTFHYRYFALAVDSDGNLWAWGDNTFGQLGNGTTTSVSAEDAIKVNGVTNSQALGRKFSKVSAGAEFSAAVTSSADGNPGELFTWGGGSHTYGGLGTLTQDFRYPAPVSGRYEDVECGDFFTLAIDTSMNLWAWGWQQHGRLGNGISSGTWQTTPVRIKPGTKFITVSAAGGGRSGSWNPAGGSTLAIDVEGKLWVWGSNDNGQLGLGDTTARNVPTQVPGVSGKRFVAVSVGANQSVEQPLRKGGSNYYGSWTEEAVTTVSYRFHSVALALDSADNSPTEVYGWGNNMFGQVGNSTTTNSTTPQRLNNYTNPINFGRG